MAEEDDISLWTEANEPSEIKRIVGHNEAGQGRALPVAKLAAKADLDAGLAARQPIGTATIAAAATTDIGALEAASITVTGDATITSLGNAKPGTAKTLYFTGGATIENGDYIALPDAVDFVARAGDVLQVTAYGSEAATVWRAIVSPGSVRVSPGQPTLTVNPAIGNGKALLKQGNELVEGPDAAQIADAEGNAIIATQQAGLSGLRADLALEYAGTALATTDRARVADLTTLLNDDNALFGAPGSGAAIELTAGMSIEVVKDGEVVSVTDDVDDYDLKTEGDLKINILPTPTGDVTVESKISGTDGGDIALAVGRAVRSSQRAGGGIITLPRKAVAWASKLEVDADCRIDGRGAEIVIEEDVVAIDVLSPGFTDEQGLLDPIYGETDYFGPRKTVHIPNASAYSYGEVVKVFSDNKERCTRPGADGLDYRCGEFARVFDIDAANNLVILDRLVGCDLITNPRIAKPTNRRFSLMGFPEIRYEAGHPEWNTMPLRLRDLTEPDVQAKITRSYHMGVQIIGCFGADIDLVGRGLQNDQFNGKLGYLAVSNGSQFGRYRILVGDNRHGWTNGQAAIEAAGEAGGYGPSLRNVIMLISTGQSQAGVDTHHGSRNETFIMPVSSGSDSGGGQFVLRGRGHRIQGGRFGAGTLDGSGEGYIGGGGQRGGLIYAEDGVVDENGDIDHSTGELVGCEISGDYEALRVTNAHAVLRGGTTLTSLKSGRVVSVTNGSLKLRDTVEFTPGGAFQVSNWRMIEGQNASMDVDGATLIANLAAVPASATSYGLWESGGENGSQWDGGKIITKNDAGLSVAFWREDYSNPGDRIANVEVITEKDGFNNADNVSLVGAAGALPAGPWTWRSKSGATHSGRIDYKVLANGQAFRWFNRGDQRVFVTVWADENKTLGALPDGTFPGQEMMLRNTNVSDTITIPHGDAAGNTSLPGAVDKVLAGGEMIRLIWDGSVWLS